MQKALRVVVRCVRDKSRIVDPRDGGMCGKKLGDGQRIGAVRADAPAAGGNPGTAQPDARASEPAPGAEAPQDA